MNFDGTSEGLAALEKALCDRVRITGKSLHDCVTAAAITCIKSARKETRVAQKKIEPDEFTLEEVHGVVGWKSHPNGKGKGQRWRVWRTGQKVSPSKQFDFDFLDKRKYERGENFPMFVASKPFGYRANLTRFVIGTSEQQIRKRLSQTRWANLAYRGLAKCIWTVLMRDCARKRNAPAEIMPSGTPSHVLQKATDNATILSQSSQKSVATPIGKLLTDQDEELTVKNGLLYARLAFKDPVGGFETCLRRAANSTTGMLNKYIAKQWGLFGTQLETPFPAGGIPT